MRTTTTGDQSLNLLRAVVFGDSGIGKTTSLGTLPDSCTTIAVNERGAIPLRNLDYVVETIGSWGDVRDLVRKFREPVEENGRKMKILAIDSLTEISDLCKTAIITKDRPQLMQARSQGRTDRPEGIYDEQMTMEDWGLYRTRMRNMVSALCHLPVHIIATSLAAWTEDKVAGTTLRGLALNGKFAQECPAFFDCVLHMEATEGKDEDGKSTAIRQWKTFHDGRVIAKDASGALDLYEETDWTKLMTKIFKPKTGKVENK